MTGNGQPAVEEQPEWELSKENYQPLKTGRKSGGLKEPLATAQNLSIDEQRKKYLQAIEQYQGDDPLEAWLSYIKWTQETFKAGGHKAELLPLLERCTRELQGIERYQTDIRYLRVWVQYADCVPDPSDVFAFLKQHSIGQEHALFYIAYATFLELRGNYAAADNMYQQGINRLAAPLDRLRAKFQEFQHRMVRRIQRKAQEQSAATHSAPDHPERRSLSVLGGRRSGNAAGIGATKRKAVATPGKSNAPAGGTGLEIYVDEEFGGAGASTNQVADENHPGIPDESPWQKLHGFEETRKENTQKASMWAGQRIKQRSSSYSVAVPAPVLPIPADPEFAEANLFNLAPGSDAANQLSLRQRLDRHTVDEELSHDPLLLHRCTATGQAIAPAPPRVAAQPPREQVLQCYLAAIQDGSGDDLASFEEVRAKAWLGKTAAQAAKAGPSSQTNCDAIEAKTSDDVTLNTRGAFEAMNAMFGSRLAANGLGASPCAPAPSTNLQPAYSAEAAPPNEKVIRQSIAESFSNLANQDVTITTKAAFEALNAVFGGRSSNRCPQSLPGEEVPIAGSSPGTVAPLPAALDNPIEEDASGSAGRSPGDFMIREDTIFIKHGDFGQSVFSEENTGGFSIREDTIFINSGNDALPAMQYGAVGRIHSGAPQDSPNRQVHTLAGSSPSQHESMLDIREDTVLINFMDAKACSTILNEETAPLGSTMVGKWGFEPGADETVLFGKRALNNSTSDDCQDTDATAELRPRFSTGLSSDMRSMHIHGEAEVSSPFLRGNNGDRCDADENAVPNESTAPLIHRDIRDPSVARAALQPLTRRATLDIVDDDAAERTLVSGVEDRIVLDDEFAVFEDHGPLPPECVDPFGPGFQQHMLDMLEPSIIDWPGVETISEAQENEALTRLDRVFKRTAQKGSTAALESLSIPPLGPSGRVYLVSRSVGSGAYARVYKATLQNGNSETEVALKVEAPPCPWEWYMCKVVAGRVPASARHAFPEPSALLLGSTASIMQMQCGRYGSLQDLLNLYLASGQRPDEVIVARLTIALLLLLGHLHDAKVLHNDIKPDNLLVTIEEEEQGGVTRVGLQLIDFGRSVDLELLPAGSVMAGDCNTEGFRCVQMREGRPWVWQADAYSTAGCIHTLLFGEYMDVERVACDGSTYLRIKAPLRRYWNCELWKEVFSALLNIDTLDYGAGLPWSTLANKLESWLTGSRDVSCRGKLELQKLVAMLRSR